MIKSVLNIIATSYCRVWQWQNTIPFPFKPSNISLKSLECHNCATFPELNLTWNIAIGANRSVLKRSMLVSVKKKRKLKIVAVNTTCKRLRVREQASIPIYKVFKRWRRIDESVNSIKSILVKGGKILHLISFSRFFKPNDFFFKYLHPVSLADIFPPFLQTHACILTVGLLCLTSESHNTITGMTTLSYMTMYSA